MPIRSKSATARRSAPCALFLSSSPTTRSTARTKATASAERRPGAPAEVLSQQLARRPGAGPREYALLQLPAGMQKLVRAACRLAHAAPGSDKRRWMDQSWRARLYDVETSVGWHRDSCRAERKPSPATEAVPATDFIAAERKFTEVCIFARPLAELHAPPTMRHHAETSATMIADLGMPNHTFVHGSELRCVFERSALHE